jgi:hypothetical protein
MIGCMSLGYAQHQGNVFTELNSGKVMCASNHFIWTALSQLLE